jgi:TPR repeat protein
MYANGQGVEKDYVCAYAWLDLAADQIPAVTELRDRIAKEMTPAQIEEARKRAAGMRVQAAGK